MPERELISEIRAVDWHGLESTYGSGEVVRDIVLGLASRDEADLRQAWQQISETNLQHQGTVYPATAAAAPFLCRIALDQATMFRAALITDLAYWATGYDEPFAPAGTAQAVRDAVRPYVGELMGLWGTDDQGLDMALVAVSVAYRRDPPSQAPAIRSRRTSRQVLPALQFPDDLDGLRRRPADQIPRLSKALSPELGGGLVLCHPPHRAPAHDGNYEAHRDGDQRHDKTEGPRDELPDHAGVRLADPSPAHAAPVLDADPVGTGPRDREAHDPIAVPRTEECGYGIVGCQDLGDRPDRYRATWPGDRYACGIVREANVSNVLGNVVGARAELDDGRALRVRHLHR